MLVDLFINVPVNALAVTLLVSELLRDWIFLTVPLYVLCFTNVSCEYTVHWDALLPNSVSIITCVNMESIVDFVIFSKLRVISLYLLVLACDHIWWNTHSYSSTSSLLSSSPSSSSSSSSCSLPLRCSHSLISLLLSCAVYLSSLLRFPYSVIRHNIPGHWNNPNFAVTFANQVQWLLFNLMDFIFQFWGKQLIDYCNCELLCVFQVHTCLFVMIPDVKLCANLARITFSVTPSTWNKTANIAQVAKHVSHFTVRFYWSNK